LKPFLPKLSRYHLTFPKRGSPMSLCPTSDAVRSHEVSRVTVASIALLMLLSVVSPVCSQDLVCCGWSGVSALRIMDTNVTTLWTWTPTNSDLPEWCKPLFSTTSDCKPCPGGKVLITSSGGDSLNGAVALVDPAVNHVLFYARAADAHSADLLPLNRVVVALSYQTNGNRLVIFDLSQPDVELFSTSLVAAHGVVWDEQRQVLWALGESVLRAYQLQSWASHPQLRQVSSTPLPEAIGHDLFPIPNSSDLSFTTDQHCWIFNRDTQTITLDPVLGNVGIVKGISVNPVTGQIVYIRADTSWWTERLRFVAPANSIQVPGAHFYKARWIQPDTQAQSGQSLGPPLRMFLTSTNTAVIQWPSSTSTGFNLQQNLNPGSANWVEFTEPVYDDGLNRSVIINQPAGRQFFRLMRASP